MPILATAGEELHGVVEGVFNQFLVRGLVAPSKHRAIFQYHVLKPPTCPRIPTLRYSARVVCHYFFEIYVVNRA